MGGQQRLAWIDIARGVSIALVVLWHALPEPSSPALHLFRQANEQLVYLRMPLFFFLAGLVGTKIVALPWVALLRGRITKLLWLFVVWSAVCFLMIDTVRDLIVEDVPLDAWRLARIFIDPPLTLWFIYALAITYVIARALRPLPLWTGLVVLGAAYLWSVASGDWRVTIPFHDRVSRLAVFFLLGLATGNHLARLAPGLARAWPLLLLGYVICVSALNAFSLHSWGVLTFTASAIGILFVIGIAHRLGESRPGRWLQFCGQNSVYIYVMHRIPLAYLTGVLHYAGVHPSIWLTVLVWGAAVSLPLAVKPLLYRAGLGVLFDHPLARRGERNAKPAMA